MGTPDPNGWVIPVGGRPHSLQRGHVSCGWLSRAECPRLPTTWASARGLQLRLELVGAILTPPQLLRVDVSALDLAGSCLDSAVALCFGSSPPGHLLVSTSSNTIAVLDARSGRVVREVSSG